MKITTCLVLGFVVGSGLLPAVPAEAAQRRATRLGNPATRFAPPLVTSDDLRNLFADEKLRADMAEILRQWGWQGNVDDLWRAALTQEIAEVQVPVGYVMPFMSSRHRGAPVCLRDVVWAGKEPFPALVFQFASNGRRYRCVTPKPCSNFFLEDLGADVRRGLTVACTAPERVLSGRLISVCLAVRNTGNVPEPTATVTLPIPEGGRLVGVSEGGRVSGRGVVWELSNLAPEAARQLCAEFSAQQPGSLAWKATAASPGGEAAHSACETTILGVAAILLEVVDLEDPVAVGDTITYEIRVTNQGSADGTRVRLVCTLPAGQEFISGSGATDVQADGGMVTMEPIPSLPSKATASWRLVVKATRAGDARFRVQLRSDQFEQPISEEEPTQQY